MMPTLFADAWLVTTTNTPTIVGLLYALSGAFFVSIYYLRRRRECLR